MLTDLKIWEFYIPRFPSMSLGQQAHHQQSESGFLSLSWSLHWGPEQTFSLCLGSSGSRPWCLISTVVCLFSYLSKKEFRITFSPLSCWVKFPVEPGIEWLQTHATTLTWSSRGVQLYNRTMQTAAATVYWEFTVLDPWVRARCVPITFNLLSNPQDIIFLGFVTGEVEG